MMLLTHVTMTNAWTKVPLHVLILSHGKSYRVTHKKNLCMFCLIFQVPTNRIYKLLVFTENSYLYANFGTSGRHCSRSPLGS